MAAGEMSDATVTPTAEPSTLTARVAREWRRERNRREPLERDLEAERRSLIRDFIFEALEPACNDLSAVLLSLENDDDAATIHHFKRVIKRVKAAAHGCRELAT
jgi:hypothetical protein